MIDGQLLALLVFSGLALWGAFSDLRTRKIPNILCAVLAISGLAATGLADGANAAGSAFLHLLIALAIGMAIYALGMWGGGDAKFYAGSSAWFTLSDLPRLILTISVAGLVLLVVWFVARRLRTNAAQRNQKGELPYGVAIGAGGIATFAAQVL